MPDPTIEETIRSFILEVFYLADRERLTEDASLIETGTVDSTGMLDIILFVEGTYGISVADREATAQNFETIGSIAAYVRRKQANGAPVP
jgi:acyl carrier protein